jgi:hypothetical protein
MSQWSAVKSPEARRTTFEEYTFTEVGREFMRMQSLHFDERRQLWRTSDGGPVVSRHFLDRRLIFGRRNELPAGYF